MSNPTTEERREIVRRSLHKRREKLLASGLCRDCGKRPFMPERTMCGPCLQYRRKKEQIYRDSGGKREAKQENHARVDRMVELAAKL
jgi:hypothetical protein